MIPAYMRFYHYSRRETLREYARSFFALVNSMYTIEAKELLNDISVVATANAGDHGRQNIEALKKQERGIQAIVEQVMTMDKLKRGNK